MLIKVFAVFWSLLALTTNNTSAIYGGRQLEEQIRAAANSELFVVEIGEKSPQSFWIHQKTTQKSELNELV